MFNLFNIKKKKVVKLEKRNKPEFLLKRNQNFKSIVYINFKNFELFGKNYLVFKMDSERIFSFYFQNYWFNSIFLKLKKFNINKNIVLIFFVFIFLVWNLFFIIFNLFFKFFGLINKLKL